MQSAMALREFGSCERNAEELPLARRLRIEPISDEAQFVH
jgi:hypothetical protein